MNGCNLSGSGDDVMQQEFPPHAPAFPEMERRPTLCGLTGTGLPEQCLFHFKHQGALRMGPEFSLKEDTSAQEDRAAEYFQGHISR